MKNGIAKVIFVKNILIWGIISICCIIALGTFIQRTYEGFSSGEEIFLPGILILGIVILGLLVFSITRVIKYINRVK
jgi:hypothetical protein